MVITLISSLTPDDENVCAPALLQHFVSVLKELPIAYAIRIETSDQVFQHSEAVGQAHAADVLPHPTLALAVQPVTPNRH
ncbi:MAG: hypothetical protein JSU08_16070 [Acidobacteria bacterium]|nr:hypothetical protein [Acidobacteriota bacterium]